MLEHLDFISLAFMAAIALTFCGSIFGLIVAIDLGHRKWTAGRRPRPSRTPSVGW